MADFADEDFDQEEDDFAYCPMCGGAGYELGTLGNKRHFRCRDCGIDFSDDAKTSATITSWNSVMKTAAQRNASGLYFPDQPFDVDGVIYYVDGTITFEYEWGDHGIGPYEFWGDRGVDSRMGASDALAVEAESIIRHDPETDEAHLLSPEEEAAIMPALLDEINNTLQTDREFERAVYEGIEDR